MNGRSGGIDDGLYRCIHRMVADGSTLLCFTAHSQRLNQLRADQRDLSTADEAQAATVARLNARVSKTGT